MRVTKVIKEYIERKVNEAYPYPVKKDAIREEFEKLREEVGNIYRDRALEFIKKYEGKVGIGYGASLDQTLEEVKLYIDEHLSVTIHGGFVTEEDILYKKEVEKVKAVRREAVDNIMITLELGGSKAELDAMLKELMEKKA